MGLLRFAVHPTSRFDDWPELQRGYLTGADGRVFPTRIEVDGGIVGCRRSSSESAKFHVAWPLPDRGRPVVSTASLPERDEPYLLAVELARGKLVQVRNQAAQWELAGMEIPVEFPRVLRKAHAQFGNAASGQSDPATATAVAQQALEQTFQAADLLTAAYSRQALAGRMQRYPQLPALLGCGLGEEPSPESWPAAIGDAIDAAMIGVNWRTVEAQEGNYAWDVFDRQFDWCESRRMIVCGGPLIDFGPGGLPTWLARWEHDFFNLQSFVCDFIETAISRYMGRIRLWEVAARANTGGALALAEEARLTLVAHMLDVAYRVDEEARLLVRIDQPFGEYQAEGQHRLSPLQLVDALLRSGVGLAGVNLDLATGYGPRGSSQRDLMELSRLIDQWSILGAPLYVTLAAPSRIDHDPKARPEWTVDGSVWSARDPEDAQAAWAKAWLPMLMSKPAVAGVFWSHVSDAAPHDYPHGGLLRPDLTPKPVFKTLQAFRTDALR